MLRWYLLGDAHDSVPGNDVFIQVLSHCVTVFDGMLMTNTPPKTNMDTENDGLEKVTPF